VSASRHACPTCMTASRNLMSLNWKAGAPAGAEACAGQEGREHSWLLTSWQQLALSKLHLSDESIPYPLVAAHCEPRQLGARALGGDPVERHCPWG
jgi:hypothetical protein